MAKVAQPGKSSTKSLSQSLTTTIAIILDTATLFDWFSKGCLIDSLVLLGAPRPAPGGPAAKLGPLQVYLHFHLHVHLHALY